MRYPLRASLVLFLLLMGTGGAYAQVVEDTSAVEFGFDDIIDEPPPAATSLGGWLDMVNISGRFDINFEIQNPMKDEDLQQKQIRNYHKFLFLKVTPTDKITLDAEVLDLSYYEIKYDLTSRLNLRAGKIWVPFGATPFHHFYGARQGDPFTGLLLPNVWSEYGGNLEGRIFSGDNMSLGGDLYAIRGFDNQLGQVINFTSGGSDNVFAYGARAHLTLGSRIQAWGSVMYNEFGVDDAEGQLLLWGGDLLLDYGLLDLPILRDLRLRAAFARAEVQDKVLVDPDNNGDSWYFRYGDYAELTYRGLPVVTPRVRYGTIIDFDDAVTNNDSHNWEVALTSRLQQHILFLAQYQFNQEEVNEVDNDLFRFAIIFEF
ncbi:MAG: hypothetical protein R2834_08770 [Rhodothermales bacterium]